jgi:hypothetical protein
VVKKIVKTVQEQGVNRMYRGKKIYAPKHNKIDNGGDSIYCLVGKWKARAKQKMHQIVRRRLNSDGRNERTEINKDLG